MKFLPFLLLIPLSGFCQQAGITRVDADVVYAGISSPVSVSTEGYDCQDLKVSTTNGRLWSTDDPCKYGLEADSAGTAIISIRSAENNELLETRTYRTERIPDPVLSVADKTGGKIRKEVLEVQMGIVATAKNHPPGVRFVVASFNATILRDGDTSVAKKINNPYFPDELKAAFNQLQQGDTVVFSDIRCVGPDKRSRTVKSMEFEIVD